MAGIFANVDSDIKKLQRLRDEINNIKKALKGINVKVDIDIAKGLEGQLQELTTQYNALSLKVAETEKRITSSANRIIDASNKITQAQERLSKSSSQQSIPNNPQSSTVANNAETASVQAQAKAYEELEREINSILGTRESNIKRILEEQNAIRLINEEIKKLNKLQGSSPSASIQNRLAQLNDDLLTHKTALSELRQAVNNNAKLDNAAATSMNALSQSLSRMRIAYRDLTEEERNSPFGKELLASIQQADAKIKSLDATIGNHQRNVGNYASGWNGLSMSIQQIGRELPSLAMGWNTFFLAISNNLPILADEIKRARVEYDNLKNAGKKATPVWKQVVASLVSWQTALTVGITLLTLYGDEIINWVSGLFTAKKALSETYKSTEEFQKSVSESSGKILTTIERLSSEWAKLGGNIKEQEKYILENKDAFDSTGIAINNVADAENLLVKNKDAFVKAIMEKSQATAIMELASKEYEKYIQKMLEAEERASEGVTWVDHLKSNVARTFAGQDVSGTLQKSDLSPESYAKEAVENLRNEAENYRKSMVSLIEKAAGIDEKSNKEIEDAGGKAKDTLIAGSVAAIEAAIAQKRELLKSVTNRNDYAKIESEIKAEQAKLNAITGNTPKQDNAIITQQARISELERKQAQARIRQQIDLENQVAQARIDAMADGYEKEQAQRELDNQKELQAIEQQKQEYIQNAIKAQKEIFDAQEELKAKQNKNYIKKTFDTSSVDVDTSAFDKIYKLTQITQTNELVKEQEKAWNEYYLKYGDYLQKRNAIIKKYDEELAKTQKGSGEEAFLEKKLEEALKELDFSEFKNSINFADVFGNLDEQTTESLTALRDKLKEYINAAAKDLRPEDLKELQDAFKNIDIEITGRTPFKELKRDLEAYKDAQDEVNQAQADLNTVLHGGEVVVGMYEDETGNLVKKLLTQEQAEKKLTKAQEKRQEAIAGIVSASDEIAERIGNVADMAGKITDTLTEAFGLELNEDIQKTIDGLSGVAEGVSSINHAVMEGDIAGAIGGLFQTVGGIVNTLNGVSSLFGYENESDPHLTEDLERLTQSNQDLELAINNLADKMEEASVADASGIYAQQKAYLEESMRNTQEMMSRSGAAYDKGFLGIGGTHSSNKNIDEAMTADEWKRISDIVGRSVDSASEFWGLTSEEMYNVATSASDLYSKIKQYADDGHEDAAQYMDEYIGYWLEMEELTDAYNEKLTSVSFDSIKDDFRNALLNMEDDTEAFAENFEKMMQNAILESMMTQTYDKKLRDWYNSFSSAMEGGELTAQEQKDLKEKWDSIVNQASEEWNAWKDMMGWDSGDTSAASSQQASQGGFKTMSQDSADELNGRFTALQMSNETIASLSQQQLEVLNNIYASIIGGDVASQDAVKESYQQQIVKTNVDLLPVTNAINEVIFIVDEMRTRQSEDRLDRQSILENTTAIVKPIQQIQNGISEVKQNTSRI